MELFQAHHQWATRPADERFGSLEDMYNATKAYADRARQRKTPWGALRVEAVGEDLSLIGKAGVPAKLTHFSFSQIANRVGAPAGYLRALPATLAAQNLNYGLRDKGEDKDAVLLFHMDEQDRPVLRAATSEMYERIWNYEVIARLLDLSNRYNLIPGQQTMNWSRAAYDINANPDAAKSLYASDHDMFAFVMTPDTIVDPMGQPMRRGLIVVNSEVGDKALKFMGFWFRDVCGNHIIWGARDVAEVSLRHVGDMKGKMLDAQIEVRKYLESSTKDDEQRVQAFSARIAATKEEVLDKLFSIRTLGISRKALTAGYEAVQPDVDGDPNTQWGMAQGLTRASQATKYADDRFEMDRAAGRLLEIEF